MSTRAGTSRVHTRGRRDALGEVCVSAALLGTGQGTPDLRALTPDVVPDTEEALG